MTGKKLKLPHDLARPVIPSFYRTFFETSPVNATTFVPIPEGFQQLAPGREAHPGNANRNPSFQPHANPPSADWRAVKWINSLCPVPVVALRLPPANCFYPFEVRDGVHREASIFFDW